MSSSYEQSGRTRQKQRTSAALIAAAKELIAQGYTPTVEDTAVAADISRTTAYRYFPNQASLLVAAHPEMETRSLLPLNPPGDVEARLDIVVREFTALIAATEAQQRATLRLSLQSDPTGDGGLPLRQGRAIGWIAEALSPLRGSVPDDELDRLVMAIRSAIGIEALVWLTDVAGLSRAQAADLMRWSAAAMLHAVLCAKIDRVEAASS
jgi:AcrR family transcriptional regulator